MHPTVRGLKPAFFIYFSKITCQKWSLGPRTSECASTRPVHAWSRICRSPLCLGNFCGSIFDGQSSCDNFIGKFLFVLLRSSWAPWRDCVKTVATKIEITRAMRFVSPPGRNYCRQVKSRDRDRLPSYWLCVALEAKKQKHCFRVKALPTIVKFSHFLLDCFHSII